MEDITQARRDDATTLAGAGKATAPAARLRVKRRISELQRSLRLAEAKVARCKATLEALHLRLKAEEPTPWADFRIRLHVGKLWLEDLQHKSELALAARAGLAGQCNTREKAALFDPPAADEKHHLQRALKCGTLLWSHAQVNAACQALLVT